MSSIREVVECFRCKNRVSKTDTRLVKTGLSIPQHECFPCFKSNGTPEWRKIVMLREKCDLYCEKCKYKFNSNKLVCPYCNQGDFLCKGDVNVHDLVK